MLEKIQRYWSQNQKQLLDVRNIGLYIFAVIVLAITWSTARTIQSNYQLQKQVSVLRQQNEVLQLQNQNTDLQNRYFSTDQYLDLAARQNLGLAAPGEKVLLVPKAVALKYVDTNLVQTASSETVNVDTRSKYVKNIEDWRDFLLGRNTEEQ